MMIDSLGLIVIILLSSARLAQVVEGEWWSLPLLCHSLLAVILLLLHKKPFRATPVWKKLVAWLSAFLPLLMRVSGDISPLVQLLSFVGVALAMWGLLSLGKAFDIVPADRGLVQEGPYRYIRHPIYTGELFSVAVVGLARGTGWNMLILLMLVVTLITRIMWEEEIISNYPAYAGKVRTRLVPGIW